MASNLIFTLIRFLVCALCCQISIQESRMNAGESFEIVCGNNPKSTVYGITHSTIDTSVTVAYLPHLRAQYSAKLIGILYPFDNNTIIKCNTRKWSLINKKDEILETNATRKLYLADKLVGTRNIIYYKEKDIFNLTCTTSGKYMYWIKTNDKDVIKESHSFAGVTKQLTVPFVLTKKDNNTSVYCMEYVNKYCPRKMMVTYKRNVIQEVTFQMFETNDGNGDMAVLIGSTVGASIFLVFIILCCWRFRRCYKKKPMKLPDPPKTNMPVYEEIK